MLTDVLKSVRNIAGDCLASIVLKVPRLEPALIAAGKTMNRMPYVDTLYRHTVDTYAKGIQSRGDPYRRFEVHGQEIKFDVSHFTSKDYYFKGRMYEPNTTREIIETLNRGGVFIDVGANLGYFSVIAALRVGTEGRVYAFEPNQALLSRLESHLRINGAHEQVSVCKLALSDKADEAADFFISTNPLNDGLSSLIPSEFALTHNMLFKNNRVHVKTDTFDSWALDTLLNTTIDLIKIDVEGAEENVLNGMRETFSTSPPRKIICETIWGSPAHNLLCQLNYEPHALDVSNELFGNILYTHRSASGL